MSNINGKRLQKFFYRSPARSQNDLDLKGFLTDHHLDFRMEVEMMGLDNPWTYYADVPKERLSLCSGPDFRLI